MAWAPDYVTLSDLKSFLRIDVADTQDDTQLSLAITTASRSIDTNCKRQFGNATVTRKYQNLQAQNYRSANTYLIRYLIVIDDIQTTSGLVVTGDGVALVQDTDYGLLPLNAALDGKPWTHMWVTNYADTVSVTATFGWTAVPSSVKDATLLQASRVFSRRNSPYGIAGSPDVGSEVRLLAKVDPDVAVALKGFGRLRPVF